VFWKRAQVVRFGCNLCLGMRRTERETLLRTKPVPEGVRGAGYPSPKGGTASALSHSAGRWRQSAIVDGIRKGGSSSPLQGERPRSSTSIACIFVLLSFYFLV